MLSMSDKDFLKQWEAVRTMILVHHPNKVITSRNVNIIEENVIKHFRDVLKLRQKQVSIERFLVKMEKRPSGESQVGASAEKCPKKYTGKVGKEQTGEPQPGPSGVQFPEVSEGTVPTVLLEEDDASVSSSPPT